MPKIRVLIVDDAVVIRKIVSDVLSEDPDIEVVGTAANGKIALQKIPQVNPDIVTMDVEMPEMNGIETLKALKAEYPKLPVVMFSTLTQRGAEVTIDALSAGASDYVCKPANVGSVTQAKEQVKEAMTGKIHALCPHIKPVKPTSIAPKVNVNPKRVAFSSGKKKIEIVTLGISTGGPNALGEFLPMLPHELPVPMVIVQHMPPVFTRCLAERLSQKSQVEVVEGQAGMILQPGTVYIAPGDYHMEVKKNGADVVLHTQQGPPENSCRPAADVLFRSVVDIYGENTLGLIMTGMGQDGLRGCELIKEAGGRVLVQDEASCVVWGMPRFVHEAGLADSTHSLDRMAQAVLDEVNFGRGAMRLQSVAVT